jgi:hypothetical protein
MTDFTPTVTISLKKWEDLQQRISNSEKRQEELHGAYYKATLECENTKLRYNLLNEKYTESQALISELTKQVEALQFNARTDQGLD